MQELPQLPNQSKKGNDITSKLMYTSKTIRGKPFSSFLEASARGGVHDLWIDGGLPPDFRILPSSNYRNLRPYPLL